MQGRDGIWATEDTPANTVAYPYVYGGWATATSTTEINYENLEPSTSYEVKIQTNAASGFGVSTTTTFTTSETGSGIWKKDTPTSSLWSYDFTGEHIVKVTATPKSGGDSISNAIDEGDKSSTLLIRGIASMEISTSNGTNRDNVRYIADDEINEDTIVSGKIVLKGLMPNSKYTINACVSRFVIDSYNYPTDVSEQAQQTSISDSDGTVIFEIDYDVDKTKLVAGCYYVNRFSVTQSESPKTDSTIYSFYPRQITGENLFLSPISRLYVFEDDKPEERPTLVDVEATNTIAGTQTLIAGSKLKIVKGDSVDGEEVESWTQGDESHHSKLEPGTYTLVQTYVPDGYDLAKPLTFTVSAQDAETRGYNFESTYGRTGSSFYIKRDDSDDTPEVVFCINAEKPYGERVDGENGKLLYYTEYGLEDAQLNDVIGTPRVSLDDLRTRLLQIVYAGYPNDKAGLKAKYRLTDSQLSLATQYAIHYYTDTKEFPHVIGTGTDQFPTEDTYKAFSELISTDIKTPAGMTVKFYMPTNANYQTLISTYFRDENPVMKLVIENAKPGEPDEDKPDEPDNDKPNEVQPGGEDDDQPAVDEKTSKEVKKSKAIDTADDNLILPSVLGLGLASALLYAIMKCLRYRKPLQKD